MFKNYFKTAWRNLVRNKVLTALNVTGLAIGVAVCLLIGVWLQRELSFDNFHPNGKAIFRLTNTFKSESESFSQAPSGVAFGAQLPKQLPAVKAACRCFPGEHKISAGEYEFFEPKTLTVDSNFFDFFGFKLIKGQPREALGSFDRIVLSQDMAKKYFGKQDPLGKTIRVDGDYPMIVSGVVENAPVNSQIQYDFLIPYTFLRKKAREQWKFDPDTLWSGGWPYTFLRLQDPHQYKNVERRINEIAQRFAGKEWEENKMHYTYYLQALRDVHLRSALRYDADNNGSLASVNIFTIIGLIVLLLACINYINLTTAGAIKRAKETAVRKVIGAVKGQLLRQFYLETFIICLIAVAAGVLLFTMILPGFSQFLGQSYNFPFSFRNILLLFSFVVAISLIAGIYPAAILSSFSPAVSLKGNFSLSKKGNAIRKTLVVFQFTVTIALIASILIISEQMHFIRNKSLGFNDHAVIEVNFNGQSGVNRAYGSIRSELLRNPYILNVTEHSQNVVGGMGNGWTTTENLKGEEISTSLYGFFVDTNYLDVYGMKLAAGRFFSKDIPTDSTKAVLVNEAAVRTFGWEKAQNAIGKRFGKGDNVKYVIGVVRDFNFESLHKPVEAVMMHYALQGNRLSLKIDSRHINNAVAHLVHTWKTLVPDIPLKYSFVSEKLHEQYGREQRMEGLFYGFAALSLLIACLGLFGLSTFVVERKVKEIGIRKVLGASVQGIVGLLSKDFLKLVLISFFIASPLAWYFMNDWLQDFAYRVTIGWWEFVLAGVVAVFIALVTVSFQSIKAAIANPVKNLRTE
jgi:putative ABC transport system permease protein